MFTGEGVQPGPKVQHMLVSSYISLFSIGQGCPLLLLKDQRPAEFKANLLQHTCLDISSNHGDLDELVQVCLIRVGAKLCRTITLREQSWTVN